MVIYPEHNYVLHLAVTWYQMSSYSSECSGAGFEGDLFVGIMANIPGVSKKGLDVAPSAVL